MLTEHCAQKEIWSSMSDRIKKYIPKYVYEVFQNVYHPIIQTFHVHFLAS